MEFQERWNQISEKLALWRWWENPPLNLDEMVTKITKMLDQLEQLPTLKGNITTARFALAKYAEKPISPKPLTYTNQFALCEKLIALRQALARLKQFDAADLVHKRLMQLLHSRQTNLLPTKK